MLAKAQELMADAVGAEHTFFSTCGSSLSVKAAMLSVAGPHEKLLVGRDAHKSVVSGLVLAGIVPVWVDPQWDAELHLAHPPSADSFRAALAEHPDARGALVTTPTPYGTCSDLAAIADVCHEHGVPLIVDEAWGAHLPFHPDLPTWAMDAGADVCVTSVHKMGSGLEQGSVFHLQGDLIRPEVLKNREDLLGTTSPSVLVYAASTAGAARWPSTATPSTTTRSPWPRRYGRGSTASTACASTGATTSAGPGRRRRPRPLQVIVDITGLGTTGYRIADWIRERHHVNLHLSDHRRTSAQLTHADDIHSAQLLLDALRNAAAHAGELRPAPRVEVADPADLRLEQAMLPRDAFFGRAEQVPWRRPSAGWPPRCSRPTRPASPPRCPARGSTPRSYGTCAAASRPKWSCRTRPTPRSRPSA